MENTQSLWSLRPKLLFLFSCLTSLYFIFLALDTYVIKLTFVLIGVVREIITIPLMAGQLVLFVWALYWFIKEPLARKGYMLWLLIVAFCNSMAIILPFFF